MEEQWDEVMAGNLLNSSNIPIDAYWESHQPTTIAFERAGCEVGE